MSSIRLGLPVRRKGYQSPEEVERREKEIISLFKGEKDRKTFTQILKEAEKIGWHKLKSSVYRYVLRLVNERKLIKEGEGRGAKYRCNFVELMELDHFKYLESLREFCSKNGLHSFNELGAVNCSILGIPSVGLTDYEQLVVQAIVEKLSQSWLLLYGLRGLISGRLAKGREIIDAYSLSCLYHHTLDEILVNVLEELAVFGNAELAEDLFNTLMKTLIRWTEKNKIPCDFQPLGTLFEMYNLKKAETHVDYPPFEFKFQNTKLYPEELVALTITGNIRESKEFSERIENWLKFYLLRFFDTAQRFKFNKAQELGEIVLEIFKTVSLRRWNILPRTDPFVLEKAEKERLLNWNLLLDRYGEKDTKFILDLVQNATIRFAEEHDDTNIQKWLFESTYDYLKKEGLVKRYNEERF